MGQRSAGASLARIYGAFLAPLNRVDGGGSGSPVHEGTRKAAIDRWLERSGGLDWDQCGEEAV